MRQSNLTTGTLLSKQYTFNAGLCQRGSSLLV